MAHTQSTITLVPENNAVQISGSRRLTDGHWHLGHIQHASPPNGRKLTNLDLAYLWTKHSHMRCFSKNWPTSMAQLWPSHVDTWLKVHGATAGSSPVLLPFYLQPPSACMESTERGTTHSPQPQHILCSSPLCLPGTPMAGHPPSSLQLHSAPACPSANSSSQLLHDGIRQKTKPSFPRPWDYWPSWHQIIFLDTASAALPLKSGALA